MRAIVAKRIRRQAYGKGTHSGPVKYFIAYLAYLRFSKTMPKCLYGCCVADQARRDYQALKLVYRQRVRP